MYAGMCLLMSIRLTRLIPASWHAFGVVVGICAAYSYYLMVGSCQMTVVKFLYIYIKVVMGLVCPIALDIVCNSTLV